MKPGALGFPGQPLNTDLREALAEQWLGQLSGYSTIQQVRQSMACGHNTIKFQEVCGLTESLKWIISGLGGPRSPVHILQFYDSDYLCTGHATWTWWWL
jgi:hypothetical protein